MVPDKFNMVDMGGIDLILMQGEEVPGLYDRLVESIAQCRYQCLYNWLFDGVIIPPTYVELEVNEDDEVEINEGVTVTPDDVIHIYSIEPPPPDPVINSISITENGVYNVPEGVDGFDPVTVSVPPPVINSISITENGIYTAPEGVNGFNPVTVNITPSVKSPFYILDPVINDAVAAVSPYIPTGLGNDPSTTGVAQSTTVSFSPFVCKINGSVNNKNKLWSACKVTYGGVSNLACFGRGGNDRSSVFLTTKIPGSTYNTLHIRYEITTGAYSGAYFQLFLQSALGFGSDVWPNTSYQLYSEVLATNLIADNTKVIDISQITDDFYIAFGDYSGYVKIRAIWLEI